MVVVCRNSWKHYNLLSFVYALKCENFQAIVSKCFIIQACCSINAKKQVLKEGAKRSIYRKCFFKPFFVNFEWWSWAQENFASQNILGKYFRTNAYIGVIFWNYLIEIVFWRAPWLGQLALNDPTIMMAYWWATILTKQCWEDTRLTHTHKNKCFHYTSKVPV